MIVPDSEFPQCNVPGFSTIVGMIGHTKTCLIIDKQWNGPSRLNERLTAALRDEITKKHQEEMIELQDAFVKVLIVDDFHKGLFLVSEHGDPRRAPFTTSRLHEVGLDVTFGPLNVGVVGFLSGPDGSDPPAGQPGRIEAPNGRTHPRRQLL